MRVRTSVTVSACLAATIGLSAASPALAESPPYEPPPLLPSGDAGVDGEITRLYLALLDRRPDAGGLDYWTCRREDGLDLRRVAAHFHGSPEFADRFADLLDADTGTWVDLLYQRILGRTPDADGRAFWIEQVDSGAMSREELIVHFSESAEFQVTTGTGMAGLLHKVELSESAFADLGDDYVYESNGGSFWFGASTTTITVEDGVVTERRYRLDPWDPDAEPTIWVEAGAEVGSHAEGAPALTVPEVHDTCRAKLAAIDPIGWRLVVEVDDAGRLVRCGGLEDRIADAGDDVVSIEDLAEGSLPG